MLIGKPPASDNPILGHIELHHGNSALFWDEGNLQPVCKVYHGVEKREREEDRG